MTQDEIERLARDVSESDDWWDMWDGAAYRGILAGLIAAALRRAYNAGVDASGAAIDSLRPSHGGAGELIERDALIAASAKVRALKLPE